jgi:hypothetical protein
MYYYCHYIRPSNPSLAFLSYSTSTLILLFLHSLLALTPRRPKLNENSFLLRYLLGHSFLSFSPV